MEQSALDILVSKEGGLVPFRVFPPFIHSILFGEKLLLSQEGKGGMGHLQSLSGLLNNCEGRWV